MKKWMLFALALSVLALPSTAPAGGFEFAVGGWYVAPKGDIGYNITDGPFDLVDLRTAGLDKSWEIMFRAKIQPPMLPGIYLQATPMSLGSNNSGDSTDYDFAFGNTVFNAGDRISSKFYLNEYDAALYIPIPLIKSGTLGVFSVELGAGARWIVLKSGLTNDTILDEAENGLIDTNALEDSQTSSVVYPEGYAAIMIKPHEKISLEGEIWGWSWNNDKFYTAVGRLKLILIGPMYIDGGYRSDYYNISRSDLYLHQARFNGPFAEIGFNW